MAQTQVIDAVDMARWIVASAGAGRTGTFNAVAARCRWPASRLPPGERRRHLGCRGPSSRRRASQPWNDLPAWIRADGRVAGGQRIEGPRNQGSAHRPIEVVVRDIPAGTVSRPREPLRAGITREREAELSGVSL